MNEKNADMDYHALLPPDYKAGGESKREELCQPDPQNITITATGVASSSGRREATRDPLNACEGKVYLQTNTGEQYIRKFEDPAKSFSPQDQKEQEFCTASENKLGMTPLTFVIFFSGASSQVIVSGLHFWQSKDHE